jgi:hypothetical protein
VFSNGTRFEGKFLGVPRNSKMTQQILGNSHDETFPSHTPPPSILFLVEKIFMFAYF